MGDSALFEYSSFIVTHCKLGEVNDPGVKVVLFTYSIFKAIYNVPLWRFIKGINMGGSRIFIKKKNKSRDVSLLFVIYTDEI